MKRIISAALAALALLSAAGCGRTVPDTATTATASAAEQVLIDRLGEVPENVILGDATVAAEYGIDMTDFEDDGYILRTVGDSVLAFGKTEDGLDRAARAYAKAVQAGNEDTLNVTWHEGYRVKRLTIAGRDVSEYTVYYPEDANANMKLAASEMVKLVEMATGVRLPVVVGEPVSPAIELRYCDDPELEGDGYRYFVTEDGVLIEGAVARGCKNGVYRFLQWELGWDQLIFGDSYLNEADHIDIPVGTTRSETPAFEFLNLYNPFNTFKNQSTAPANMYEVIGNACHGLVTNNFFEETDFSKQPCFTDDDLYEICLYNVENYVAARYGDPNFRDVDIAQYDTPYFCMCSGCMEVFDEEGGHAGAVVRFANRLTEDMNVNYPGIIYKIFAYLGTNQPPKVTVPHEQVYITFCLDRNCSNHKIDGTDCKDLIDVNDRNNSHYAKWLEGWCDISSNVYVWAYALGTGLHSYTIIDTIYDDYRYYAELGIKGISLETEDFGAFSIKRIENQLMAEMNWNTDMTREEYNALAARLLEKEYGPGWEHILDYIDQWNYSQDMTGYCWQCWGWMMHGTWGDKRYSTGFYKDRFDHFIELMEAAAAEADSALQEEYVMRLYASVLYKGCYSSYYFEWLEGDTERMAYLAQRYEQCMDIVRNLGHDPQSLITAADRIRYAPTIEEAAWSDWVEWYERITSRPIPEDAPVISK